MKLLKVVTDFIYIACHYVFSRLTEHTSRTVSMWLCSEVVEVKRGCSKGWELLQWTTLDCHALN